MEWKMIHQTKILMPRQKDKGKYDSSFGAGMLNHLDTEVDKKVNEKEHERSGRWRKFEI